MRQSDLEAVNTRDVDTFREEALRAFRECRQDLPSPSPAAALAWALVGVLLAPLTALLASGQTWSGLLAVVLVAPFIEEFAKPLGLASMMRSRPYLVSSRAQIVVLGVLCGAAFATIENLLYRHAYLRSLPPDKLAWVMLYRWTACVALHITCSAITAYGIATQWESAAGRYILRGRPPRGGTDPNTLGVDYRDLLIREQPLFEFGRCSRWFAIAVALHALHNAGAVTWQFLTEGLGG